MVKQHCMKKSTNTDSNELRHVWTSFASEVALKLLIKTEHTCTITCTRTLYMCVPTCVHVHIHMYVKPINPAYCIAENFRGRKFSQIASKWDFAKDLLKAQWPHLTILNFREENFRKRPPIRKISKILSHENFPLCGTVCSALLPYSGKF